MSRGADDDDVTAPAGKPLDPLIGTQLGDYRVEERLGHGGMGALYRAVQPVIGRQVAIKVLLPEAAVFDPASEQRMLSEARAANAVRHPNIIEIFTFGALSDGRPYMVMELLEGRSLAEELERTGRLEWKQVRRVLDQVMAALEAAHGAGVVHRDLKPGNIFVTDSTDGWRIKVIDFGLARQKHDSRLTRPGTVLGTPAFMAPEQVRGADQITPKADIYSMGVVGWTLLMGRAPFDAEVLMDILQGHLSSPMPALEGLGPLPAGLEALLRQMMQKEPSQRPSASEIRAALAALREPSPAGRGLVAIAAVGGVLALGAAAFVALQHDDAPVVVPAVIVAPPKPVVPVVVEPAPVVVDERAAPVVVPSGYERAWPCAEVSEVSPVRTDAFNTQWSFFSVAFHHDRSLVVFTDGTKKKQLVKLTRLRGEIAACRGQTQRLGARKVDERHIPFRTDLVTLYGGDMVELDDLTILAPP